MDVLGLPESLVDAGGPIDLLRRKLACKPQIHGGKTDSGSISTMNGERSEQRTDRRARRVSGPAPGDGFPIGVGNDG